MKIGIIGAMEPEVKSLCEKLEGTEVKNISGTDFYQGKLNGKDVVIVQCGIGKVNAALRAQLLISNFGITHLINTGIAGAMASGLGIFDFVVSEKTVYHDFDTTAFGYEIGQVPGMKKEFDADQTLVKSAVEAFSKTEASKGHKLITGLVASGDQFISGGERKAFIKNTFNPACVEMEGCAIAHTANLNKVPFIIVRCMSDMADDNVESVYNFNEEEAAKISAGFVEKFVENLQN